MSYYIDSHGLHRKNYVPSPPEEWNRIIIKNAIRTGVVAAVSSVAIVAGAYYYAKSQEEE